ncbi:MAG TPA: T3SS effector HopA1 family protein [Gallionella sp.]|nr:T3SS effector HopA1 family protein [Gallionella sp.]
MNTKSVREELAEIFAALQIHSLSAFTFRDGAPVLVNAQAPGMAQPGHAALLNGLRDTLYSRCYTRYCAPGEMSAPQNLIPQLMQANRSQDRWDPGWSIYQLGGDGRISVQKGERSRTAVTGEYATNKAPGMPPKVGDLVNLRVYPGSADLQPGFYFSFGNALSDQFDEYALLRFYFNIKAEGAAELLRAVSSRFNCFGIPYRYKTLTDVVSYTRADAAVLYVAKRYYHIAAALVSALVEPLDAYLRPQTPMFCKTLRPGIGLAEEPGTGESFGMHRCRLVAEGVIDAWMAGSQSVEARMDAVQKRFSACGLALEASYLNAKSVDLFAHTDFAGGIAL